MKKGYNAKMKAMAAGMTGIGGAGMKKPKIRGKARAKAAKSGGGIVGPAPRPRP